MDTAVCATAAVAPRAALMPHPPTSRTRGSCRCACTCASVLAQPCRPRLFLCSPLANRVFPGHVLTQLDRSHLRSSHTIAACRPQNVRVPLVDVAVEQGSTSSVSAHEVSTERAIPYSSLVEPVANMKHPTNRSWNTQLKVTTCAMHQPCSVLGCPQARQALK